MLDEIKMFDKTIAMAEYHTRGLFSAVVLIPKGDVSKESYLQQVIGDKNE